MEYKYPTHFQIQYTNDDEYRECMIHVFHYDDTDENSDNSYSTKLLDLIFEKTSVHLREIYEKASAVIMMEDLDIGLAILFSYDYFSLFHLCLCDYLPLNEEEQIEFPKKNQYYLQLLDKLNKTPNEETHI
jgi:hypothetical protein